MKSLRLPVIVSLAVHALLILTVAWWVRTDGRQAPLAGGGGGGGVSVEIVGGKGFAGDQGPDVLKDVPSESTLKPQLPAPASPPPQRPDREDAFKISSKPPTPPRKIKPGRQDGDGVPVGSSGPAGSGQGSGPGGPGSGSEGGTSAVLAQIRAKIERAKHYPRMARRMNIEGVSRVRFAIDASGQPQGLSLKTSSGSSVLDDEALATIRRAAPFPPYEEALEIGIRFKIDE